MSTIHEEGSVEEESTKGVADIQRARRRSSSPSHGDASSRPGSASGSGRQGGVVASRLSKRFASAGSMGSKSSSKVSPESRRQSNVIFDPGEAGLDYDITRFRVVWDSVMFLEVLFIAFFLPVQASVLSDVSPTSSTFYYLKLLDGIFSAVCALDLVLRRRNEFNDTWKSTAFFGDCLTTIPIWLIVAVASPENSSAWVSAQWIRIIRLRRLDDYLVGASFFISGTLKKVINMIGAADVIKSLTQLRPAQRILEVFFLLFLFGSVPACVYYMIGRNAVDLYAKVDGDVHSASWLYSDQISTNSTLRAVEDPMGVEILRFMRSLYFAIQTFFTVGFGDNAPQSGAAMVYSTILALCGVVFLAVVIANIESAFMNLDSTSKFYEHDFEQVEKVLRATRAPQELQAKVRTYFMHLWNECKGLHENRILENFPHALSNRVETLLYKNLRIPLFTNVSGAFQRRLFESCQIVVYGKGDLIVAKGTKADRSLFIVKAGKAFLSDKSVGDMQRNLRTINRGQTYGMHAFLLDEPYKYNFVVPHYGMAEVLVLTFRKFKSMIENENKQDLRSLVEYSVENVEANDKRVMESLKEERSIFNKIEAYIQNMSKSRKSSKALQAMGGADDPNSSSKLQDIVPWYKMNETSNVRFFLDVLSACCTLWFTVSIPMALAFSVMNEASMEKYAWFMFADIVFGSLAILDEDVAQRYFMSQNQESKLEMKTKRHMTLAQRRSSVGQTAVGKGGRRTMIEEMQMAVKAAEEKRRGKETKRCFLLFVEYTLLLLSSQDPLFTPLIGTQEAKV